MAMTNAGDYPLSSITVSSIGGQTTWETWPTTDSTFQVTPQTFGPQTVRLEVEPYFVGLEMLMDGRFIALRSDGMIFMSNDGGSSWMACGEIG